jgi:hypothetical protein
MIRRNVTPMVQYWVFDLAWRPVETCRDGLLESTLREVNRRGRCCSKQSTYVELGIAPDVRRLKDQTARYLVRGDRGRMEDERVKEVIL